ncbi:MAG: helix-turn-helix domain-containing protein [Clostridium sp.]
MRAEYITYDKDLPLKIYYTSIEEYPLHWHDCIELIYVLKGKINITIDADSFELYENEIEIINIDETHRLYSTEENKVLIFQIDPYFFEKYYKDIKNIFFYTNSSESGAQNGEQYEELRSLLSMLLCERVQMQQDYDEEIENILINLLYHLINNFHYLTYEKEELKENMEQLDRYHRISKYIFNNYNNNITLKDIAKKEFLSPHYLSHEIKYATGYSFTDLINQTRVEESLKLLLSTDMSITEISDEIGFSHPRYFNKHFKMLFGVTPLQYRRKNKVDEKTFEKIKKVSLIPLDDAISPLEYYLEDYERFNFENKLWNIHIDMNNSLEDFDENYKEIINIGESFDLLIEDNKDILEEIQDEIHFNYGRIEKLFSSDMGVFSGSDFFNWNRVKTVFEFLDSIYLNPLIVIDEEAFTNEDYKKALKSFYEYFNTTDIIDTSLLKFQFSSKLSQETKIFLKELLENTYNASVLEEEFIHTAGRNKLYDTSFMLPYIIHNLIFPKDNLGFLRAYDVLEKETNLTNEVFFGSTGLVNDMGIKKPSYYAYYLLSKLKGEVVTKGEGFIVTKFNDNYSILLYSYDENFDDFYNYSYKDVKKALKKPSVRKLSLNMVNIKSSTRIVTYEVNERIGSSYDYWVAMGKPDRLNKEEKEILYKASFPKIDFKYAKKASVLNIITELKGYGATLILINSTKN